MGDDFKGDMSAEKYLKINKKLMFSMPSEGMSDTECAKRDLDDLVARGLLRHMEKSRPDKPRYELAMPKGYDRALSTGEVVKPADQKRKPSPPRPRRQRERAYQM